MWVSPNGTIRNILNGTGVPSCCTLTFPAQDTSLSFCNVWGGCLPHFTYLPLLSFLPLFTL